MLVVPLQTPVSRDVRLDQFDAETDASERDGATVEPASPTYRFSPDGRACDACGEGVQRLWADDGRLVCESCKPWSDAGDG